MLILRYSRSFSFKKYSCRLRLHSLPVNAKPRLADARNRQPFGVRGNCHPDVTAIYENVCSQATNMIVYSYTSSFQAVLYYFITLLPYSIAHVEQDVVALPLPKPP